MGYRCARDIAHSSEVCVAERVVVFVRHLPGWEFRWIYIPAQLKTRSIFPRWLMMSVMNSETAEELEMSRADVR